MNKNVLKTIIEFLNKNDIKYQNFDNTGKCITECITTNNFLNMVSYIEVEYQDILVTDFWINEILNKYKISITLDKEKIRIWKSENKPKMIHKYCDMKNFELNWYFNDESIKVTENDLKMIKPLTTEMSKILWDKYVHRTSRHLCLVKESEYFDKYEKICSNWHEEWQNNRYEIISRLLEEKVNYKKEDKVIFFWMKEYSVETTWEIFCKYWINFLFEDERPILINYFFKDTVMFDSSGNIWVKKEGGTFR